MATTNEQFFAKIKQLLEDGNGIDLKKELFDETNAKFVTSVTWDLIPELCQKLNDAAENQEIFEIYEDAIIRCANVCNPKEMLLALLEQADMLTFTKNFKALLYPIQITLLRLPAKRQHSLDITLETIYGHIKQLDIPEDYVLEGDEKALNILDPNVIMICEILDEVLNFLKPFVEEISEMTSKERLENEAKVIHTCNSLTLFLFKILAHPIVFLDLTDSEVKSQARDCVNEIMRILTTIQGDFHKLVRKFEDHNTQVSVRRHEIETARKDKPFPNMEDCDEMDDELLDLEEQVPSIGLACFQYIVHGQCLHYTNMPSIFRPEFLFEFNLKYVSELLKRKETTIIAKAVALVKHLLLRIDDTSLSGLIQKESFRGFFADLSTIIIHCPSKEIRQKAVSLLPLFLQKLNWQGRYQFILYSLKKTSHVGLLGYMTTLLKDQINASLKLPVQSEFFCGPKLAVILKFVFELKEGVPTDLLDQSDRIMGALNLLRYLIIRDPKTKNTTGVWDMVPHIQDTFSKTLRSALEISRAHFKLEEDRAKNGELLQDWQAIAEKGTVTVGDNPLMLPNMSPQEQLRVIKSAIFTIDLMESILCRVNEVIDQKPIIQT
ncbi:unnamed protein product [Owenia fusiformis]|uniref:Uncharacterized protein n=1 Tax=Owenia fusiformis TaxID=6347 RepID=A0A8J1Y924_OWEFU|nr:unnamed protein product [Owenia fusiformis]